VIPAVGEQDVRRAVAEGAQPLEERIAQVRVRRRAAAVEEDEQWLPLASTPRRDKDLLEPSVQQAAAQREPFDMRAASAPVAAPDVANDEKPDRRHDHGGRQRDPAHRARG